MGDFYCLQACGCTRWNNDPNDPVDSCVTEVGGQGGNPPFCGHTYADHSVVPGSGA